MANKSKKTNKKNNPTTKSNKKSKGPEKLIANNLKKTRGGITVRSFAQGPIESADFANEIVEK